MAPVVHPGARGRGPRPRRVLPGGSASPATVAYRSRGGDRMATASFGLIVAVSVGTIINASSNRISKGKLLRVQTESGSMRGEECVPMRCSGKTVEKRYGSIRYRGKAVVVRYRYDEDVNRWAATSKNVPLLITENDSIEEIERELPEILDLVADSGRTRGAAGLAGSR
ncbi:MAG: DUF1902 domain-containing protein [Gemmatimonadetes bacterium]|nr:DUF1902 domain-containing protein [Gemmatimonadota bacterium]